MILQTRLFRSLLCLSLFILSSCGGGGADTATKISISSVKVFGDSLADVGTFGFKFTVQTTPRTATWNERTAATYGVTGLCARYVATSATTVVLNPAASTCTNYAVGGGRINYYSDGNTTGFSITKQLSQAATDNATYSSKDMLIVDGGGNDMADMFGAYLTYARGGGSTTFTNLLLSFGVTADTTSANTISSSGVSYAQALADALYTSISINALAKGAQYVVVLNAPPAQKTLFATQTLSLSAYGLSTANQSAIAGQVDVWVQAFNARLASKFTGESRVAVVDFYTDFNSQLANPGQYGLTNVSAAVCPEGTAGTASAVPTYTFTSCTEAYLNANIPSGATSSSWWKTYAFSDNFHPTPYGHQLMAQLVSRSLAAKGWL